MDGAAATESNGNPNGSAAPVTLEQYSKMTDAEKANLTQSRRKKLEKLLLAQRKKEAKAAAAASKAQPSQKSSNANSEKKKRKSKAQADADAAAAFVNNTPPGEKKILSKSMAPTYQPRAVEAAWYECPEDAFIMVIPPPNVTGSLHLGHALMCAVEDALARYHRMHGKVTLYLPGVDHAGIATQVVVEKQLKKLRNLTRYDLGREAFVDEVWKWKNEYGGKIVHQLRRIGSSLDWDREEFTMSDRLSNAVKEAFVRFYDDGLIYRDTRLVNWSSALNTAISDIEVENVDIDAFTKRKVPGHEQEVEFGVLTNFAYEVDDSDEELVVATTRLETMLGDTGVAVHPDDERYKHLIGKFISHPFVDRKLPIIADGELVDMSFGTGVVKITPAHDPNDFACGRRNNLPEVTIFTKNGEVNENGGEFCGMKRYVARVEVEKALEMRGLLRGKKANPMSLPVCSRSGDIVEPMLLPQWWVNCKDLAKKAADAVRQGELEIVPEQFQSVWYRWLDNIRDWCISRQLWWGHRIPAYEASVKGDPKKNVWVVGRTEDEAMDRASRELGVQQDFITLTQDEDVLDTWFSSGLFPFSVFGWPEETEDLQAFYPTSVLETGHDILFFWVARMVMMGIGLTGKLPFKTVMLHSLVRDKKGRKMSKSLGNVIDPLEVIHGASLKSLEDKIKNSNLPPHEVQRAVADQKEDYPKGIPECGADALRIGLLAYMTQGGDINLDVSRVIGYRNFCNKLWNATKFALSNLGESFAFTPEGLDQAIQAGEVLDLWILSRLNDACAKVNEAFTSFNLGDAVAIAYSFWMNELCGIYLEGLKPAMKAANETRKTAARMVLYECLSAGIRMLHPMMPYVTEELYQRLPGPTNPESICLASYPIENEKRSFENAEASLDAIMKNVQALRALKAEYGLKPASYPSAVIMASNADLAAKIIPEYVQTLVPCGPVEVLVSGQEDAPHGTAVKVVSNDFEAHVVLTGLVDFAAEIAKLEASAAQKRILIEDYNKKMSTEGYETRVPLKVREKNSATREKYIAECSNLDQLADRFRQLLDQASNF
ncbi:Valine--tRNA ligase [Gracilaria domingensis]|nr:Valine--tRNA ligase [Gracilaria domingensis]